MSMSNTTKRVKEIRRKTRREFSSEEKIRIVLEGLRGVELTILQDEECIAMMNEFISAHPELWNEDIGE